MFKVLKLGDPEWVREVMTLPPDRRDVHMDQRMLAPYVKTYNWKAGLAVTIKENAKVIQPFLINNEGQLRHAYNFGGPISDGFYINGEDHFKYLDEYAIQNGCTNQYCTLNPFLQISQLLLLSGTNIRPQYKKNSVIVDLDHIKPRGTTRNLANKAQSAGVIVSTYPCLELSKLYGIQGGIRSVASPALKHFYDMYELTMDRNEASKDWRFELEFFKNLCQFNTPLLFGASYKGKLEAACIVLYRPTISPNAYYHFAASNNSYPELGINHMMILAVCEYLKANGAKFLHLGGGRTDDPKDGLFVFKSGFSKLTAPVYTYTVNYKGDTNEKAH
jgi:hypothetical protein